MKRYGSLFLITAFLLLSMVSGGVSAQTGDPDGDGIFGTKDSCPNAAGPASNNGCPLPKGDS